MQLKVDVDIVRSLTTRVRPGRPGMISGLAGSARSFFLYLLATRTEDTLVCLVPLEEQAYDLHRELRGFLGPDAVCLYPSQDLVFWHEGRENSFSRMTRLSTLSRLASGHQQVKVLIATAGSLVTKVLSPQEFRRQTLTLAVKQEINLEKTMRRLVELGYQRCQVVTDPGSFGLRGGVLDVYPPDQTEPFRLELWADEIESIRSFDPLTQRSGKKLTSVSISPAGETGSGQAAHLLDYVSQDSLVFLDERREFERCFHRQARRQEELLAAAKEKGFKTDDMDALFTWDEVEALINRHPVIYHAFFPGQLNIQPLEFYQHISQKEMEPFFAHPELTARRIKEWVGQGYSVAVAMSDRKMKNKIREELGLNTVPGVVVTDWDIEKGFISPTLKMAVLSDRDVWGKRPRRTGGPKKETGKLRLELDHLRVGDYVVHENHGIGLFQGITKMEVEGFAKEYLVIQYAGSDRLYLPVDKLEMLTRYTGPDDKEPRLSKLGGTDWEKTKNRVRESIREMAQELLRVYALRQTVPGFAFSPDTVWQKEFEDAFEYEETADQIRAVAEVKKDMETPRPMDRLICGDVGYGKTEVALRAAFKAVMDHKQVAILVPTTILAEQHYQTCLERFKNTPVVIEVLSRFRTPGQQKRILEDLKKGVIDIIIGTHRLLSRDVRFKDLGLLVVDEEHRFGVRQKERIKALKETVDALSLSATPIPRTLHMALTGLRDLSVIETPPPDRYPITTYVLEYNEDIIREAIRAEVERGGQVFAVHNRIQDIEMFRNHLQMLVPEVKMEVAHGRVPEDELADIMKRFLNQEFQVLVCTTIIESGLDMPNVNTLIVDEADRLGLAQLYQLRGRVGRSKRLAYAYFTYRPDKSVTEAAQKRLNAIREFTELGSGMKIALRDLEIRGAGNILGPEQHGYIAAVGFDLYCRLLEEETARLNGTAPRSEGDTLLDVRIDAFIPDDYVGDIGLKLQVYRRAMFAASIQEIDEIRAELKERFGSLPVPVENLLRLSRLRVCARSKDIKSISTNGGVLQIRLNRAIDGAAAKLRVLGQKIKAPVQSLDSFTISVPLEGGPNLELLEQILEAI